MKNITQFIVLLSILIPVVSYSAESDGPSSGGGGSYSCQEFSTEFFEQIILTLRQNEDDQFPFTKEPALKRLEQVKCVPAVEKNKDKLTDGLYALDQRPSEVFVKLNKTSWSLLNGSKKLDSALNIACEVLNLSKSIAPANFDYTISSCSVLKGFVLSRSTFINIKDVLHIKFGSTLGACANRQVGFFITTDNNLKIFRISDVYFKTIHRAGAAALSHSIFKYNFMSQYDSNFINYMSWPANGPYSVQIHVVNTVSNEPTFKVKTLWGAQSNEATIAKDDLEDYLSREVFKMGLSCMSSVE